MQGPARTVSAPNSNAPFRAAYGAPTLSRPADGPARASPPPALPTPGAGGAFKASTKFSPTVPEVSPASPNPVSSPAAAPATPTPQAQPENNGKPKTLADIDAVWAKAMATATDEAGPDVMAWAKSIWDTLRSDSVEKPLHLFERRDEGMFGGLPAGSTKRHILVKERTLPHQVMGILSRVTPDNYEAIEEELMNLPIRQSEDAEIAEIVDVFFRKAIRPEDSLYAPQYARLIGALVQRIEMKEREREGTRGVSKVIRSAVVNKCKEQYENLPELKELQEAVATGSDDPSMEGRRKSLMEKLKANIGFLGQLFVNRLVSEKVVIAVLYSLLWDHSSTGRNIQDYEIEQFFTLLEVCGPRLTQASRDTYQGSYITTLNEIATISGSTKRTQILALNCKEFIENGYVRRGKRTGPMKLEEYNRQAAEQQVRDLELVNKTIRQQQQQAAAAAAANQQQSHGGPNPRSALRGKLPISSPTGNGPAYSAINRGGHQNAAPAPAAPAQPQPMSATEFKKVFDGIIGDAVEGKTAIILPDFNLPPATLLTNFTECIYRFIGSKKWEGQRRVSGPVLRAAKDKGVLSAAQISELVKTITVRCINEDIPIIFELLCEVLDSAPDVFGYPAYNSVLRIVFSHSPACSFSTLKRAVQAVMKRAPGDKPTKDAAPTSKINTPVAAVGDFPTTAATRIHLLPHVLRFVGYSSVDPKAPNGDGAESDECDDEADLDGDNERESDDILDIISAELYDSASDQSDAALITYSHLMMSCEVTEAGIDAPDMGAKDNNARVNGLLPTDSKLKMKSLNNLMTARKVLSAVFTFARFNKKLLEALISIIARPLFDNNSSSTNSSTTLLLELYETWIELDRKPYNALDTAYETIFNTITGPGLINSTAPATLLREIERNNDDGAITKTRAKLRGKA